MAPEGLTFTLLGFADGVKLPGPVAVEVARSGFAPGAGFPFVPGDPTSALVLVESGSLTARVEERAWSISRGAALRQAMAAAEPDMAGVVEAVAAGAEATLEAGDVAYVPGGVSGEVRNDSQAPAAALIVLFIPSDTAPADATPAP
jgi:quercetin dioxygenase-like cupin family protein